jgi:hypothetical protein
MFSSWIISTIRAQETVDATSPAAVLAKLEREEAWTRTDLARNAP